MVQVVKVEAAGYFSDEFTSSAMVKVTLKSGLEYVSCDGILIWFDELADDELFADWKAAAGQGEAGYEMW